MEKWTQRAIHFITALILAEEQDPRVISARAEKNVLLNRDSAWNVSCTPESENVRSEDVIALLDALENEPRAHLQNLVMLRNGHIFCECSRPGYDVRMPHLSHSMSKTVTGMAVGLLMDDGKLKEDDPVLPFFPEVTEPDPLFSTLTVRHLLTMESGSGFGEAGSVSEEKWTEAFFETPAKFTPGSAFSYNSMNTYLLARIVTLLAGKPMEEFVSERIFAPLGITEWLWERGPEDVAKGGWGLYLSCEGWAKLGFMMANKGVFEGVRILSEEYVAMATAAQSEHSREKEGNYAYGYQLWSDKRENGDFLFNGMLGQNVIVSPETGIVIALNSSNNELFHAGPTLDAVRAFIDRVRGQEGSVAVDWETQKALAERQKHFFEKRTGAAFVPEGKKRFSLFGFLSALLHKPVKQYPQRDAFRPILDRTYKLPKNNAAVLPLLVRMMQNNFGGGIETIRFDWEDDTLILTVREDGKDLRLPVGERGYAMSTMEVRGEQYRVGVLGEAGKSAEGRTTFTVEFVFPELPNTHLWVFTEENGAFRLSSTEEPNQGAAEDYLTLLQDGKGKISRILALLEKKYGKDFLVERLRSVFNPEFLCIPEDFTACDDLLRAEEEKQEQRCRFGKRLLSVLDRVFGLDGQGLFSSLFSGMRSGIGSIFGLFGKEKAAEPSAVLESELFSILPNAEGDAGETQEKNQEV